MSSFSLSQLNAFDIAILVVIFISTLISFWRGFLREAVSLVSWLVGILLALRYSKPFHDNFLTFIQSNSLGYLVAFILIVIAVLLLGMLINFVLKRLVSVVRLGLADRLVGVLFGFARGVLVIAVVLIAIQMTSMQESDWMKQSQLSPKFLPLVGWLQKVLPEQVKALSQWASPSADEEMTLDKD